MPGDELLACTKKTLVEMARREGIAGWHGSRKDELGRALADRFARARKRNRKAGTTPVQAAAARNTSGAEELVEVSKYDVGGPTLDLSAKVPKDLPVGYGKDRIVVMVRDPYWLHCYWELTRQAGPRPEAALAG